MRVGEEGHVVVAVPGDVADGPRTREPADPIGRFEDRHRVAVLREPVRERQPEHAAPDNGPTLRRAGRRVPLVPLDVVTVRCTRRRGRRRRGTADRKPCTTGPRHARLRLRPRCAGTVYRIGTRTRSSWPGLPTTRWNGGTSRVTVDPMPTIANRPISRPGPITQPAPIVAPSRTYVDSIVSSGPESRSVRRSGVVARGNRSFVNTAPAPTITPSSMNTELHTYTNALSLTRSPTSTPYAM